jgi:imidazolonepropionase-like amidohydrolase
LTGCTIIDGTGSDPLHGFDILVDGDRIVSIQPTPLLDELEAGIETLNLGGATLLPGFIDCHVHISWKADPQRKLNRESDRVDHLMLDGTENARKTIEAGFTTVQDLAGVNEVTLPLRDEIASGKIVGPRIVAAGACIAISEGHGTRGSPGFAIEANDTAEVLAAVRQQARAGANVIKIMVGRSSSSPKFLESPAYAVEDLRSGIEEAHRAGLRVCAHAHSLSAAIHTAVLAGVDSIEHGSPADEKTLRLMVERGTFLVPTLSVGLGLSIPGEEADLPYSTQVIEWMRLLSRQTSETVRRAHSLGVPIALGTDAGVPKVWHGANAREFELLVECGLSPIEAIVAGTGNAAVNVGRGSNLGTIEQGQIADFVAVRGDPLGSIGMLQEKARILLVVKEGRIVVDRR